MKKAPIVIILLIGLGILGYIFLNKQNTEEESDIQVNANTKTYSGNGFKIDYPKDMTVQEEDAEGGPYRMVYFSRGGISISYVQNSNWFEQYDLSELEYTGSQIINGNTFKIYNDNEATRMWLKTGNTGYAININGLGDGDGLPGIDINTFYLLNQ